MSITARIPLLVLMEKHYTSSDMGGGQGGMDIWYCKLDAGKSWGSPINMVKKVKYKRK